ncbi:UPF0587 protein C1orf123-like protein [Rhynchospora pubera]|uniref:UPF0587 protein C1orf123-like protein n=1 Tax=Rhynchospora pubera TaxID=906938 RepID=A0AAV8G063_9POAL|nr:UPF0587 protein C1orf123-like protein [Rhynchospora pubera]
MVYFALKITGNLVGVDNLQPRGGADDPDHPYLFKLQCENCGEISGKSSCVMLSEEVPLPRVYGRGNVNLVQKCKLCDRVGTVKMISGFGKPLNHRWGESGRYVGIMIFECHGLAPVEFSFGGVWKAQSSKKLLEIDLSKGEFNDFDERVHVTDLKAKFDRMKSLWWYRDRYRYSPRVDGW